MKGKELISYAILVLRRILFRSTYSSFSVSLIALAVGLLIPDLREFLVNIGISAINYLFVPAEKIPPFEPDATYWPQVIALGLIAIALLIFAMGWRLDLKLDGLMTALERKPNIRIHSNPSWITSVSDNKKVVDSEISASIHLSFDTG